MIKMGTNCVRAIKKTSAALRGASAQMPTTRFGTLRSAQRQKSLVPGLIPLGLLALPSERTIRELNRSSRFGVFASDRSTDFYTLYL